MSDQIKPLGDAVDLLGEALALPQGQSPFPWQVRLLMQLMRGGGIPRSLDVPTGLGKTATIAIWLVARVLEAPVPRRLVYVVDRRAVVDQATTVALSLREWVRTRPSVAAALGLEGRELPISTLRGQFIDNREWMDDPATPAIVVGTVDMVGSRLLFEGYGTSHKLRPYHAALLGNDCLFAIDEAHLVPPFEALIETITAENTPFTPQLAEDRATVPRSHLLALSATGRGHHGEVFDLGEEDLNHAVVRERLEAPKRIELLELEGNSLAEGLAGAAWKITNEGTERVRCILFANKRDDAEKAAKMLSSLAGIDKPQKGANPAADVELLTGGRRVFERTEAADRLHELGFVAGSHEKPDRPAFLVATSAGEVGVDLDADHMVCDLVAWERMVQRLGRVNRRGKGKAAVKVIIGPPPDNGDDGALERRLAQRLLLESLPRGDDQLLDGSPNGLRTLIRRASQDVALQAQLNLATTAPPLRPALDRPTLEAWSMTSLAEHPGRPEVAPWLRGWDERRPQTRLVWRARLPIPEGRKALPTDLRRYFEAAPPHTSEVLETESDRAIDWLSACVKRLLKRATSPEHKGQPLVFLLDNSNKLEETWNLTDLQRALTTGSKNARIRRFRDRTLVLAASIGGLDRGLLDPKTDDQPPTADGESWLLDGEMPVTKFRVRTVAGDAPAVEHINWRERERLPLCFTGDDEVTQWLVIEKWRNDASTEHDRSAGPPQLLVEHQTWAAKRAASLADRLGLSEPLKRALCIAARLHDEGKRSARWQKAFRAPRDGVYAKTRGPIDLNLLDGYRHELGSLPHVETDKDFLALPPDLQDLVLHVVAAHHGFARPFIRTDACDDAPPSAMETRAREIALRFFRLQDRWGPWGLAWWEALLRAADQQASRDNDARDRGPQS